MIEDWRLVGMTRGARKRAALWEVFVPYSLRTLGFDPSKAEDVRAQRRHMAGCLKHSRELTDAYVAARPRYGLHGRRPRTARQEAEGGDLSPEHRETIEALLRGKRVDLDAALAIPGARVRGDGDIEIPVAGSSIEQLEIEIKQIG